MAAARFEQGVLWPVEAPDGAQSYAFGTLHAGGERVLDLPAAVREALAASSGMAIELLGDEASARRFQGAMGDVRRAPGCL